MKEQLRILRAYLLKLAPGEVRFREANQVEKLFSECWPELTVTTGDAGLEPYKLLNRTEHLTWNPPVLTFQIERARRKRISAAQRRTLKFQAAASETACQSNGPFLTNLRPLLLIVRVAPPAAPSPVTVQVAGGSGGPPIFTLGGTGSTGNNTTYQLQVKSTNMPAGTYHATMIDLNNVIPSFGIDFTKQ